MRTGRKILNLRHDRSISQQDLARLCSITPSALSKIEAGINSPRANIICRIAEQLGVTMEYLLDESLPYPYQGFAYRQRLIDREVDPESSRALEVTAEEAEFLETLRNGPSIVFELAKALPEVSMETIRLAHFVVKNARVENPKPSFLQQFQELMTTGEVAAAAAAPEPATAKKKAPAKKAPAKKKKKKKTAAKKAPAKSKKMAAKKAARKRR